MTRRYAEGTVVSVASSRGEAKLEFIDSGDTTLERELMPYMLTAGGQTMAELIVAGELPMLTAGAGR